MSPDISMCDNKTCPLRNTCYRFIADAINEKIQRDLGGDK
jgi:hypothetical protein